MGSLRIGHDSTQAIFSVYQQGEIRGRSNIEVGKKGIIVGLYEITCVKLL